MIIDVREQEEFAEGHVDGAVNIPLSNLTHNMRLNTIPKNQPLVLYCRSGNRSAHAMRLLQQIGYRNVTNGINQEHIEAQRQRFT